MAGPRTLVLLRGINVGGRHRMPMAELRTLFERELGCAEVSTYIQSGNLVCTAPPRGLNVPALQAALAARFGFAVPVTLREQAEFRSAVAANPFVAQGVDREHLHVVFLDAPLPEAALGKLRATRSGDEDLAALGRELYLLLPHGVGRSKLALAMAAPSMGASATMRNWKTVLALEAMLAK